MVEEAYNDDKGGLDEETNDLEEADDSSFNPAEAERFLDALHKGEEWYEEGADVSPENKRIQEYLRDIGKTPLLSREEEFELMAPVEKRVQRLESIKKKKLHLTGRRKKDIETLRRKYLARFQPSISRVIRANLRLVVSIAKKYIDRGLPLLDLVQEGNMGLMKAVEKYQASRGYRFSTYATWWIRQAVERGLADYGRTIRLPVYVIEILNRIVRLENELRKELSRDPTPEEVSERVGISLKKLTHLKLMDEDLVSLDSSGDDEGEDLPHLCIEDHNARLPEEAFVYRELASNIRMMLSTLTPREEKIVRMRLGIGEKQDYTLEEVGDVLGLTQERIRQLELRSLTKLRHPSRAVRLQSYVTG